MIQFLKQLYNKILLLSLSPIVILPNILAADPQGTPAAKFVGVGSCSASNCHGSVKPLKGSEVLQNEYYTWLKHDKHARAYQSLVNKEGQRMANLLGIADASKEPLCLECHATYDRHTQSHGERYQIEDGVSCESCHGAAERWLSAHTAADATHNTNLKNGLAHIAALPERARVCLSCHQGDQDAWVSHDLYGAGHPRLTFELDTFGALEPRHWVVDQDYIERKGSYVPLRAWLVGQVVHAQGALGVLNSPERPKKGGFPELSLFDCYSCHHSLTEKQWQRRSYGGKPGRLKLNLPSLLMLQQAFEVLDPTLASSMKQHIKAIHDTYQSDGAPTALAALTTLVNERLVAVAAQVPSDDATCAALFKRLTSYAASSRSPTYEVAEQLAMGIQAIVATSAPLRTRYKRDLDRLFTTLKSAESFDPEPFTRAAQGFLSTRSS